MKKLLFGLLWIGILIYVGILITSYYNLFLFLGLFEPEGSEFVAMSIAVAFEVGLFYFAFVDTIMRSVGRLHEARLARFFEFLTVVIVWMGNLVVMYRYFEGKGWLHWYWGSLNVSYFFPLIASLFFPALTIGLAYVSAQCGMTARRLRGKYTIVRRKKKGASKTRRGKKKKGGSL